MPAKILIVEDDEAIVVLLRYNLEAAGFTVFDAGSGDEALHAVKAHEPDLIVLDWMLPGRSGVEICRVIRSNADLKHLPIIMLTAKREPKDRIIGLETGADDYVVKPFSVAELIARIRGLLRRAYGREAAGLLAYGDLVMNTQSHRVTFEGRDVVIGPTEYRLLEILLMRQGRVLSRAQLIETVWNDASDVSERTVDVHVGNLRRTLMQAGAPDIIETVRGAGYRLGEPGAAE